jgi:hypothetical protein
MGRRRRQGDTNLQKTKILLEDSVKNEENEHLPVGTSGMTINMSNETMWFLKKC